MCVYKLCDPCMYKCACICMNALVYVCICVRTFVCTDVSMFAYVHNARAYAVALMRCMFVLYAHGVHPFAGAVQARASRPLALMRTPSDSYRPRNPGIP
jgi:hypothetical protein